MKVYVKNGRQNYREKRMIDKLNKYFEENPNEANNLNPARNESELKAMFNRYIPESVEYTETKSEPMAKDNFKNDEATEVNTQIFEPDDDDNNQIVDPFNRENPIVREYVLGKDALGREAIEGVDPNQRFAEPTTFTEAFEIPDMTSDDSSEPAKPKKESFGKSQGGGQPKKQQPQRQEPANPHFDEMTSGKKRRSSKKFAKYIVEAVCMLSQKGFVWYANKDINPSKLAEYELNNEMDLSLLLTLDDGQQVTVKEFFQSQCLAAEQLSHVTDEQKHDLTEALTEVLLEKGAAPTPTQELLLIGLTIFGGQVVTLITLKSQTNSLLKQLRSMKSGNNEPIEVEEQPAPAPTPAPQPVKEEPQPVAFEETTFEDIDRIAAEAQSKTEIEQVIETLE